MPDPTVKAKGRLQQSSWQSAVRKKKEGEALFYASPS
jgi:hypothetical protein